jgi:hypothetical protein
MMKQLRSLFGGKPPPPSEPKDIFAAEVEQFLRSASGVKSVTRASRLPAGGEPRSLSVWTKGVRSYLPRTERVMLLIMGDQKGAKPKATVEVPFESIEGRLTAVPDLHPARFDTTGEFPSEAELRLMGGRP